MKKTMISILALFSTIAMASGEVGINVDTKTDDIINHEYAGAVELFGKYTTDILEIEGKTKLVDYEKNKVNSTVVGFYNVVAKVNALKTDQHEVVIGTTVKKGYDQKKEDKEKGNAELYVTYTNKMLKDITLGTTVKSGFGIEKDKLKDPFFLQSFDLGYKKDKYERHAKFEYKVEGADKINLTIEDKNDIDLGEVKLQLIPTIGIETSEFKFKPSMEATVEKGVNKLTAKTELEVDKSFGVSKYVFKLDGKTKVKSVDLEAKNELTIEKSSFGSLKTSLEAKTKIKKWDTSAKTELELNKKAPAKNLNKLKLSLNGEVKLTDYADLKLNNEIGLEYKDREFMYIKPKEYVLSNKSEVSGKWHKTIEGIKLTLSPTVELKLSRSIADDLLFDIHDNVFLSLTPGLKFEMNKEFKENIVLDFEVGAKEILRYDIGKHGTFDLNSAKTIDPDKIVERLHKGIGSRYFAPKTEVTAKVGLKYKL